MTLPNKDTPRVDSDNRPYPSPEYTTRIRFEGNECVVMHPEEYESLYALARKLERELAEMTEHKDEWMGRHYALSTSRDLAPDTSPSGIVDAMVRKCGEHGISLKEGILRIAAYGGLPSETPRFKLWRHMMDEHGVTLTDSELEEIILLATVK